MGRGYRDTPQDLLRKKCSPARDDGPPSPAAAEGIRLEPEARDHYARHVGIHVRPVCLQSRLHPWLRASLDGLSLDGTRAVEIKCGARAYEHAEEHGELPGYYYDQLQHTLAVTGLQTIDIWCYWPDYGDPLWLSEERNDDHITLLLEEEHRFWQRVQRARGGSAARGG